MADNNSRENDKEPQGVPQLIKTLARQHGIDLHDDPELLKVIEKVNCEKEIPAEVYALIAELIMHFYKLRDQWSTNR